MPARILEFYPAGEIFIDKLGLLSGKDAAKMGDLRLEGGERERRIGFEYIDIINIL